MTDAAIEMTPPPRRSRFLASAALFASVWLLAFGIDGVLSTVDDFLQVLGGLHGLTRARNDLALIVVLLLAFPMALLLFFVPHLPKRIFLLPVAYTFWANLFPWPFDLTGGPMSSLPLDLIQLAVFGLAIFLVKRQTGRLYVRASDLPVKAHLVRRTMIALGSAFGLMLIALPVVGAMSAASAVEKQTGGYINFTSKGIEARESVFTKDGKTVRLIGMVHIGEGRFYRDLFASFPADALVLVEGVSDDKGLLKGKFSYNHIAGALGLTEQSGIQTEWMVNKARAAADGPAASQAGLRVPSVIRADIDISDFSANTISFLGEVGELYNAPSIWGAWRRIQSMSDRYTDKDVSAIYGELIDRRNAKLISTFDREAANRASVVIPWGAEHMPGIENALRARGYVFQSRQALNVVEYASFF